MRRAAIAVGVDSVPGMAPLNAAAEGAREFAAWAKEQGCETTLLRDRPNKPVRVGAIFDAVEERVKAVGYDQLIIYFSGHGVLQAPGAEFWLLSKAFSNGNEAVSLLRAIEDARNCGIPHVVFVSDACRSSVTGPPLNGLVGSLIFPTGGARQRGEIDVLYATRPGDLAFEVPAARAARGWRGLFTDNLLKAVKKPQPEWIDQITQAGGRLSVITTRCLKPYLETVVPRDAGRVNIRLKQSPEVHVETALPKFFALIEPDRPIAANGGGGGGGAAPPPPPNGPRRPARPAPRTTPAPRPPTKPNVDDALSALETVYAGRIKRPSRQAPHPQGRRLAREIGLESDVEGLVETQGRQRFETQTGFTVFGVRRVRAEARGWRTDIFREGGRTELHVRLWPEAKGTVGEWASIVFEFDGGSGTVLPVLPGFIATLVVEKKRTSSVNYIPSGNNRQRYAQYQRHAKILEQLKAFAAVSSRNGRLAFEDTDPGRLANVARQAKGIDPTMGVYAAYAYAQIGRHDQVYDVYKHMRNDDLPVPFDVLMLAARHDPKIVKAQARAYAPFVPMICQGWALLAPGDPLHTPRHEELRAHLMPSLWTTFDSEGVAIVRGLLGAGVVR